MLFKYKHSDLCTSQNSLKSIKNTQSSKVTLLRFFFLYQLFPFSVYNNQIQIISVGTNTVITNRFYEKTACADITNYINVEIKNALTRLQSFKLKAENWISI